eukprot:CAMPEP_0172894912 /NCGR_PEP_ID=MMETSP1075-20121228/151933_1 /TAXON_ID=2916 /ORGANISM="Ceratium fusus, Strain PA161109" /LENGTH=89 /DNA_ID=CAMNT_0013750029 /DNA_START=615 /DNA_END=884 /DNA_ORIENTATION=+
MPVAALLQLAGNEEATQPKPHWIGNQTVPHHLVEPIHHRPKFGFLLPKASKDTTNLTEQNRPGNARRKDHEHTDDDLHHVLRPYIAVAH